MINIKEIKENIKCPQFGDTNYGKWGILKLEQRLAYKELIEQIESADNVIKSQCKEIERLNKGYCELKEKCNKGECDCTHEEYNSMCEANMKLYLEIERLTAESTKWESKFYDEAKKVDKAIEYIEENVAVYGFNNKDLPHWEFNDGNVIKLLKILKGVDKE